MIVCYRCGKENQDHYKFCLGCGAELTGPSREPPPPAQPAPSEDKNLAMMNTVMASDSATSLPPAGIGGRPEDNFGAPPAPVSAPMPVTATPPSGVSAHQPSPSVAPPPAHDGGGWHDPGAGGGGGPPNAPPPGSRNCPSCGSLVPLEFRFCGVCGHKMEGVEAGPAGHQPGPAAQPSMRWRMVLIRPDGTEGGMHELRDGDNQIGREHGEIFENDGYLSPTHASLLIQGGSAEVRDLGSLNGVFVKMSEDEELRPGQVIRIGQELLRFDMIEPPQPLDDGTEVMGSPNPGYWGKITVVIGSGVDGSAYPLLNESVTLGRERGEINFPDDGYVSGLHARLTNQNGKYVLSDLGSSNGTFIRVQDHRTLYDGSFILLGQQLFRLSVG